MLYDFLHGNDRSCLDAVILADLIQGALLPGPSLAAVHGDHQSQDLRACALADDRKRLADRGSRRSDIFYDNHPVSVIDRASQQDPLVAVVLDLFTVRAVADIPAVF